MYQVTDPFILNRLLYNSGGKLGKLGLLEQGRKKLLVKLVRKS